VSLEPIITKLSAQNWIDATKRKNVDADRMVNQKNLFDVNADVSAILLRSNIKLRDFMTLKVGDIIPSEKKIHQPIDICVNRRKKYSARPGLTGKKRAFQVVSAWEPISKEKSA
jgi:flagellar motor switch protein FliM